MVWIYITGLTIALAGLLMYVNSIYAPAALFIPLIYYAVHTYLENARRSAIDEEIPRALLELSSTSIRTYNDVFSALLHGFGVLSEEVQRIDRLKLPPERKIRMLRSIGRGITERAFQTIRVGMAGGANTHELFREVAEDLEAQMNIERSKQSSLALQRYTTMLTAGVFVPAVLGLTAKLAKELISTHLFAQQPLVHTILELMPIHVLIVGVETAIYLALVDGKAGHTVLYAVLLIPLALGIFWALSMC